MTESRHNRSLSFGSEAAAYERGRPSYPPEAIDWLLPPGARDVLDLGAGTGKLTTRLVERGWMWWPWTRWPRCWSCSARLFRTPPALLGTAEQIPLPDNSVDAVLVAQAWHWFDPERAVAEVARVLRPGGRLGLVWNARDERLGWVKDLGRIIGHENAQFNDSTTLPEPFVDIEHHRVEWTSYLTPPGTDRLGGLPQLLHHLAGGRAHPDPRRGARLAEHASRTGELDRPGAAVHHGGYPGYAGWLNHRRRAVRNLCPSRCSNSLAAQAT